MFDIEDLFEGVAERNRAAAANQFRLEAIQRRHVVDDLTSRYKDDAKVSTKLCEFERQAVQRIVDQLMGKD